MARGKITQNTNAARLQQMAPQGSPPPAKHRGRWMAANLNYIRTDLSVGQICTMILEQASHGRAVEIGGPTQSGYWLLQPEQWRALNTRLEVTCDVPGPGVSRVCDGAAMPDPDGSIDVLLASAVPIAPQIKMKEAFRVLKDGGLYVVQHSHRAELRAAMDQGFEVLHYYQRGVSFPAGANSNSSIDQKSDTHGNLVLRKRAPSDGRTAQLPKAVAPTDEFVSTNAADKRSLVSPTQRVSLPMPMPMALPLPHPVPLPQPAARVSTFWTVSMEALAAIAAQARCLFLR